MAPDSRSPAPASAQDQSKMWYSSAATALQSIPEPPRKEWLTALRRLDAVSTRLVAQLLLCDETTLELYRQIQVRGRRLLIVDKINPGLLSIPDDIWWCMRELSEEQRLDLNSALKLRSESENAKFPFESTRTTKNQEPPMRESNPFDGGFAQNHLPLVASDDFYYSETGPNVYSNARHEAPPMPVYSSARDEAPQFPVSSNCLVEPPSVPPSKRPPGQKPRPGAVRNDSYFRYD